MDIVAADAIETIQNSGSIASEAKQEDIQFHIDQQKEMLQRQAKTRYSNKQSGRSRCVSNLNTP